MPVLCGVPGGRQRYLVVLLLLIGGLFLGACGSGESIQPEGEATATADVIEVTVTAVTTAFPETDLTTPAPEEETVVPLTRTTTSNQGGSEAGGATAGEPGMVEAAMTATTGIQQQTATATLFISPTLGTATTTTTAVVGTGTTTAEPDDTQPGATEPTAATPEGTPAGTPTETPTGTPTGTPGAAPDTEG